MTAHDPGQNIYVCYVVYVCMYVKQCPESISYLLKVGQRTQKISPAKLKKIFRQFFLMLKTLQMCTMSSVDLISQELISLHVEFTSKAHLALPLQLRSEPLEVTVSPPYRRFLQFEDGQVGLWANTQRNIHTVTGVPFKCCLVCCSVFSLSPRSGYTNGRERRENQDISETVCACLFLSNVVYEGLQLFLIFIIDCSSYYYF